MNKEEVKELLEECCSLYSSHVSMYRDASVSKKWFTTLEKYSKEDIYDSLQRHKDGAYSRVPIVLGDLIRNVRTIEDKKKDSFDNIKTSCKICGRIIKYTEAKEHEDKCRNVEYIIKQYKKWFNKELTISYLWSLPDYEFDKKYDKLLKYILENTNDEKEKSFISNYFEDIGVQNE